MAHTSFNPIGPNISIFRLPDATFEMYIHSSGIISDVELIPDDNYLVVSGKCAPRTSTDVNVCMLTWTDEPYGKFTRDIPISLHPGTEYIVLGHRQECSGYVLRYTIRNKKGHRSPSIHPMCRPHHTNGPVPEPDLQPYYPGPLNDIPVNATPRQSVYSVPRDSPVHFHNVSGQFTKAEYTCTGPSFHQAQNLANQRQDRTFQSMRPGELTGHRFVPTDINDITIPTDQNIVISPPTEPPHDKYSNLTGNTQPPFTGTTMHSNLGGYQRLVTRDLESGITPFEQRNVSFPAEQQEAAENSRVVDLSSEPKVRFTQPPVFIPRSSVQNYTPPIPPAPASHSQLYDTSSSWGPPVSNHAAQHPSFGPDYNQGHVLQVPSVPSSEPVYQANPQVAIEVYNPEEIRPCTAPGPATVVAVNPGHYSTDAVHTQDVSMPTAEIPLSPCDVPAAPFVSIQAGASVIDTTQGAGQAERGVCNISAGGDAQGTTLKNLSISSNAEPCGVPFSERDGPPLGTYVSAEAQKGNSEGVGYQPEAAQQSLGPEGDLYIFGSGDKQIESPATTGMPSNLCNVPMDDHLATDTFGPEVVTEPSCHGTVQEQGSSENFASQEAVLFPPIQRGPEPVEAEQIISGPSESGPPMVTNHMPIQAETEAYTAETREMGSSDNTLVNAVSVEETHQVTNDVDSVPTNEIVRVVTESTGEQTVAEHAQVQAQEQEYTTSEVRDARKLDELGADAVYAGEAHQVIVDVNSAQDQISTGNSQEDKGAGGNPGREIIKNTGSPQELTDAPVPIDVAQELPLMTANASSQAKEVTAECSDSRIESCVDMQSFAQEQVVLTESTLTTEASESKQVGVEKTYDETLGKTVVAEEQSRDIRETSSTQNFNLQDTPESPQVPDVLGPHSQNAPLGSRSADISQSADSEEVQSRDISEEPNINEQEKTNPAFNFLNSFHSLPTEIVQAVATALLHDATADRGDNDRSEVNKPPTSEQTAISQSLPAGIIRTIANAVLHGGIANCDCNDQPEIETSKEIDRTPMREGAEADGADIHAVPLKTDFEREPHCLDGQEILHAAASEHLDSSQNILTHATPAADVAPPEVAVDHTDAAIWAESQNEQLLAEQKDVALTQIEVSKETIHTSVGEGIGGVSAEVDVHLPGNPQRFPAESQIFTDVSLHDAAVERDDAVKWEAPMDIKPEKQGPAPPENIKRGWNFLADSHEFEKLSTTAPVPSLASVSAEQQETEWTLLKSPLHEAEKSHGDDVQPHSDTEGSTERRILTSSNSSSSSSSGVMVQRVEEDGTGGALANFTNCDSGLQQPIDTQRFTEQISSEALVQGIMERDTGDVQATVCGDAAQSGHYMQDSAEQPNLSRESSSSIVFDEVVEGDMEIISLKSRGPGDLCDGDRVPLGKQSVEQTNQSVVEPSSEQIIHPSISEERGANFVKYEESSHASSGAESERGSQSRNDSDNRVKRDAQTLSVNASMTGRLDSSFPGSLPADAESFTRNYGARSEPSRVSAEQGNAQADIRISGAGDKLVSSIGDGARFSTEQKDLNLTGWSSNTMARASVEESRDFGGLNVQQTTDHTTNVPAFPYEGVADRRERSVSQSRFIQKSRGAVAGSAFFCPHCSPHPCKFLTDLSREEQELSVLESQPNTQCGTSANYQQLGNATSVREHETLKTLSNHSDDATNSVPMVDHQLPAEGSIIFAGRARTPPNLAVLTAGETSGKEAEHRSVEEESHSATNPIDSLASINLHLPINTSVEDGDGSLLPSHLTAGQNSLTSTASSSSEFALYKPEGGQQSHLSGIVEKSTVIESLQEQIQEDLLVQGIDGDPRYAERNIPFIERPALNADTISNDFLEPRDRATPKSDSSSIPGNTASGRDIDQPVEKPQTSTPHSVLAATMPSTGEFAVQGTSVSVPHAMEQVSNSNEEVTKEASIELQIEEAVTSSVHSVTHVDDSNETHVVNRAHHSEAYVANEIDETDPVSPCHHAPAIDEVRPESATGAAHEGPLVSVDSEICASDNIHEQADVHVDVIHKRVTTDDEGEGVLSHRVHEEDTIASPAAYDMDHEEDGVDSDRPLEDTPAEIHKGAVIDEVLEQNAPEQDQVPAVLAHEEVAVNELHEIVAIEKVEELTGDQVSPEASLDKPLENNPISEVPEEFTSGAGEDSEVPPAVDVCEDASVNKVCQEHAIDGIEESREGAITDLVQSPAILAHREARVIGNEAHDEAESHEEPIGDQVSQTIPRCKATNNPAVNSEGPEEPASCRDDEAPPAIDDTSRSVTGTNEVHEEPALDEAHQELGQDGAAVRQEIDTGTICDNVTHFNADEDVFEEHTEVMHLELHDNVL